MTHGNKILNLGHLDDGLSS